MKNETKLEKVKKWLKENGIKYRIPNKDEVWKSDLFLFDYMVNIKISVSEAVDAEFYEHTKGHYPVFIRTGESPKFIIEKVQNTIIKSMQMQQKILMRKREKEERKLKASER